MYVCICNGITDKAIRKAVLDGADSFRDVCEQLGVASNCGQCSGLAKAIVQDTLQEVVTMNTSLFYAA